MTPHIALPSLAHARTWERPHRARRNKLDFFIIAVSIPDLVSLVVPALTSASFFVIFRVFRCVPPSFLKRSRERAAQQAVTGGGLHPGVCVLVCPLPLASARVARLIKLINKAKGLRTLFNTLISSLPAIFNVGSLLVLVMFIYTVLGMNIFGSTDLYADPILNFNAFPTSLLTMFR